MKKRVEKSRWNKLLQAPSRALNDKTDTDVIETLLSICREQLQVAEKEDHSCYNADLMEDQLQRRTRSFKVGAFSSFDECVSQRSGHGLPLACFKLFLNSFFWFSHLNFVVSIVMSLPDFDVLSAQYFNMAAKVADCLTCCC